jgi:hypothetical protein
MHEFIRRASAQLDIPEAAGHAATQGVLLWLRDNTSPADFTQIIADIPGARDVMTVHAIVIPPNAGSADRIGGRLQKAAALLGGTARTGIPLASALQNSGLASDRIARFNALFVHFLRERISTELLGSLLTKVPELARAES